MPATRQGKGIRGVAGGLAACAALALLAAPAPAQVVPQGAILPGPITPPMGAAATTTTPAGVYADPLRVYGDDAPTFSPLGLLGGLGGALGLHGSAGVSVQYNDNIARLGPGRTMSGRYRSKNDWIIRPSATLGIGHQLGRQQLFLSGTVGRDIYARNSRLNRDRVALNGGLNWALGVRCAGQIQGGYSKRGTQFGQFEEVIPSTQQSWTADIGGRCRSARGLSLGLDYNQSSVRNETQDPLGLIDRSWANVDAHGASGSIGYPLGQRGEIGVRGNWREQTFPNQLLPDGSKNGSTIWGTSAYLNYGIGRLLRANGSIGKNWIRPKSPFGRDFSGLSWDLGLTYQGPRLGVSAGLGQSANGSSGGLFNYSTGRYQNVSVSYQMNRQLRLGAGAAFSNLNYHGLQLVPETLAVNRSKNERYYVGADYRLNQMLSFSLDLNHQNRSSIPSLYNYHVNTAMLGVRAQF